MYSYKLFRIYPRNQKHAKNFKKDSFAYTEEGLPPPPYLNFQSEW